MVNGGWEGIGDSQKKKIRTVYVGRDKCPNYRPSFCENKAKTLVFSH